MIFTQIRRSIIHSYIATKSQRSSQQQAVVVNATPPQKPADNSGSGAGKPSVTHHKPGGYKIYKMISIFVCAPMILLLAYNTFILNAEDPNAPPPEFHAYEYLCKRDRRYPWGDGTKTFFHNPHKNALKDGYEGHEDDEEE